MEMNNAFAGFMLANLLERVELGEPLGRLTSQEINALRLAVAALHGSTSATPSAVPSVATPAVTNAAIEQLQPQVADVVEAEKTDCKRS